MNKWNRRGFITAGVVAGGALVVGVAIRPGHRVDDAAPLVAKDGETLVNIWVKIDPENVVTAIIPQSEMGQGVMTTLGMMLADEMDADWDKMEMEQAPAHDEYANYIIPRAYLAPNLKVPGIVEDTIDGAFLKIAQSMGFQTTGGSMSVRLTGMVGLRTAGAAAREMLINAAAEKWDVLASELRTQKSMIFHDKSSRSEPYASFASSAAEHMPPKHPTLKSSEEFKLMGKSLPRVDLPEKVDGTAVFGIDVKLPDMKYAVVMAPPVFGSMISDMDATEAEKMPGVVKVLNLGDLVAVVADRYWQAKNALPMISIKYTKTDADVLDTGTMFGNFGKALDLVFDDGEGELDLDEGDANGAIANATKVIEAEYRVPYLAHATMEPMNATAWVHDGKCEVWAGMQNPLGSRNGVAEALEIDAENVIMHNVFLGGGFGRRARPDFTNQAARIAAKMNVPVKMIWSREEDIRHDHYRPGAISRFKGGLDKSGKAITWINHYVHKHDPVEASLIPYAIDNKQIGFIASETHIPFGAWRSVDHSQHGFFTESFVDEMAVAAGKDGYTFRRELLKDSPRHLKVLDKAAEISNWAEELPEGKGRGIAFVDSFGTVVAEVAEVDMTGDTPRVTKVYCVADPGFAMHPDSFKAQMESGIIYGLTATMFGDVSIENGAVVQSNFHDYEMIRMNDAPEIIVEIINSGATVGGAGEPSTPPIAPAVTNAIFAATGKRVRELPIKNVSDLKVAPKAEA